MDNATNNSINKSPITNELLEHHFLVDQTTDEYAIVNDVLDSLMKTGLEQDYNKYLILTTLQCNAQCKYCYEQSMPKFPMTKKTAEDLANFIKKSRTRSKVRLLWYGGEPLLNTKVIDVIITKLKQEKIEFESGITTNAYLFDERLIEKAVKKWNLKGVQITLDGSEKTYNSTKNYKNAQDSPFYRVINNIKLLLHYDLKVTIRLNLSLTNIDSLIELTDILSNEFKGKKSLRTVPRILYQYDASTPEPVKTRILNAFDQILFTLIQKGLYKTNLNDAPNQMGCMAENENCIVIFPDGILSRCSHYYKADTVGDIWNGITDKTMIASFKEREQNEKCKTCLLKPDCRIIKKCPEKCDDFYLAWQLIELDNQIKAFYQEYLIKQNMNEGSKIIK